MIETRAWMSMALVAAVAAAAPLRAGAEPEGEDRRFAELVSQAAQAYEAGRYRDAVEDYLRAYERQQNPKILLILAHIHDRALADDSAAIAYYRTYLATDPADRAGVERELEAAVMRRAAEDEARTAEAHLTVSTEPRAGVTLSLDGERVAESPAAPLVRPPGPVRLGLRKAGFEDRTLALDLEPGVNRVHVALEPLRMEPEPAPGPNVLLWTAGGFSAGAAVSWGTTAILATVNQDERVAVASDVLLGLAAAGVLVTAVLWVVD